MNELEARHSEKAMAYENVMATINRYYLDFVPPTVKLLAPDSKDLAYATPSTNTIYFNIKLVEALTPREFELLTAHETTHILLDHFAKRKQRVRDYSYRERYIDVLSARFQSILEGNRKNILKKTIGERLYYQDECEADHGMTFFTQATPSEVEAFLERTKEIGSPIVTGQPYDQSTYDTYVSVTHPQDTIRITLASNPLASVFKPGTITFDAECNMTDIKAQPVRSDGAHDLTLKAKPYEGRE